MEISTADRPSVGYVRSYFASRCHSRKFTRRKQGDLNSVRVEVPPWPRRRLDLRDMHLIVQEVANVRSIRAGIGACILFSAEEILTCALAFWPKWNRYAITFHDRNVHLRLDLLFSVLRQPLVIDSLPFWIEVTLHESAPIELIVNYGWTHCRVKEFVCYTYDYARVANKINCLAYFAHGSVTRYDSVRKASLAYFAGKLQTGPAPIESIAIIPRKLRVLPGGVVLREKSI